MNIRQACLTMLVFALVLIGMGSMFMIIGPSVPTHGFWIFAQMMVGSGILMGFGGGILCAWLAMLMYLGSRIGTMFDVEIENDALPTFIILAGVILGTVGIAPLMAVGLTPFTANVLYASLVTFLICLSAAAFIRGLMKDKPFPRPIFFPRSPQTYH